MRLASRLFRRQTACLAPPTATELLERGLEAARDVVEAASEAIEAAPRSSRGRTAVTVAAVTATALVATAAYVWWKRRDHVATADTVATPGAAPVAAAWSAPAAASVAAAEPAAFDVVVEASPVAPEPVVDATPAAAAATPGPQLIAAEALSSPIASSAQAAEAPRAQLSDDCGEARRATPEPSVASTTAVSSRPPAMNGRFSMPGVRGVVLPGGGGSLP